MFDFPPGSCFRDFIWVFAIKYGGTVTNIFDCIKVLLSEPLVILADDPRTCSEFVSAAVDLIRPVSVGHLVSSVILLILFQDTFWGRLPAISHYGVR